MVNHIQIIFWTLSVMACNLKIQKIYHWRVVILNWPFPVLCRDPPICKFCRFKTFSRFKSLTFQKNWKNFWPIQFVRVFSLNEEIGHIPKLHLNFTKNVKRKFLSNQQASTECVWIRCYSYFKCNKTSQYLLLDCCCVYHQIKSYCQPGNFLSVFCYLELV